MEINFNKGILGLEEYKKYKLLDLEGLEPYKMLQSTEEENIGLVVVSPFEVEKKYEVKLSEDVIKSLNINSEEDVVLYTIVNLNSDVSKITTNLRAPIVINVNSSLGEQLVLSNENYKIKHPIIKG